MGPAGSIQVFDLATAGGGRHAMDQGVIVAFGRYAYLLGLAKDALLADSGAHSTNGFGGPPEIAVQQA